jgi:hypothetical protein
MQVTCEDQRRRIWDGTRRLTLEGQWRTTIGPAAAPVGVFLS